MYNIMSSTYESKNSFSQLKAENKNKKVYTYFNLDFCYTFKLLNFF